MPEPGRPLTSTLGAKAKELRKSPTFWPDLAMAVVLLVTFAYLLWVTRNRWFYLDEWSMIVSRDFNQQPITFSTPWDEHWVTLLYAYYQFMYHVVGLHSYLPYMAVGVGLHVAVVYCLWRIMVACDVTRSIAVGLCFLAGFFSAGFEMLLWSFQLVHWESSIVLGLMALQLTCFGKPSLRRDLGAAICLTSGLLFSQLGLLMLCCCGLALLIARGPRMAIAIEALPAVSYAAWFLAIGAEAVRGTWDPTITSIPSNVVRGLTTSLAAGFGMAGWGIGGATVYAAGGGIALVMVSYLWTRRTALKSQAVPIALAVAAAGFFVLTSLEHGYAHGAIVSRFLYVAWVFCVPLLGLAITALATNQLRQRVVLALTLIGGTVGAITLYQTSDQYQIFDQQTKQYVTAAAVLTATKPHSVLLSDNGSIQYSFFPMITEGAIRTFVADNALNYDLEPSAYIDQLVELQLQLSVTPAPLFASPPGPITAGATGKCPALSSGQAIGVEVKQGGSLLFAAQPGSFLNVAWDNGHGSSASRPHGFPLTAGSPFLNSSIDSGTLILSVADGSATVCQA